MMTSVHANGAHVRPWPVVGLVLLHLLALVYMPVLQLLFGLLSQLRLCCLGRRVWCNSGERQSREPHPREQKWGQTPIGYSCKIVTKFDMLKTIKYTRQTSSESFRGWECDTQCDRTVRTYNHPDVHICSKLPPNTWGAHLPASWCIVTPTVL